MNLKIKNDMVEVIIVYKGQLRCESTHTPSSESLQTDAPVDNNGKGETFSPTDLMATALGSCMLTIMGIVAERCQISLEGTKISVRKTMSQDLPRRIVKLAVKIDMPIAASSDVQELFENAAITCPVHQSLHPDIEVPIDWQWR